MDNEALLRERLRAAEDEIRALRAQLERAQTEMAGLRESEARLRAVIDNAPSVIYLKDRDGRHLLVNPEFGRVLHVDIAQVPGKTVADLFPPEVAAAMSHNDQLVLDSGKAMTFEEMVFADHTRHTYVSVKFPLCSAGGTFCGVGGISTDITERKQIEAALQESEALFRSLADNANAIIGIIQGSNFVYANPYLAQISGYSREELLALDISRIIAPQDRAIVLERARSRQMGKQVPTRYEFSILTKDGKDLYLDFAASLGEYHGKPAIIGIAYDITERKRIERILSESEERFRSLYEHNYAVMLLIDPETGQIEDANPAALSFYGYTRAQLTALRIWDINMLPPEEVRRALAQAQAQGRRFEFRHRLANGAMRDVEVYSGPIIMRGRTLLYSIVHDITERKQAVEALRFREELLRILIEHAPAAVAMFDRDMRYLAYSHRWLTDYHLGERNLIGLSHYEVFPEIGEEWKAIHQRCLAGASERRDEDPFMRADGTLDWVRWEIVPWRQSDGSIGGIIMFTEVITGHKRAEERIKRERAFLASAIELLPFPVVFFTSNSQVLQMNQAGQRFLDQFGGGVAGTPIPLSGDQNSRSPRAATTHPHLPR